MFCKTLILFYLMLGIDSYEHDQSAPPQDENDTIIVEIADLSMDLLSVPSLMIPSGMENFVTACEVFLKSSLNVGSTAIDELHVTILSQEKEKVSDLSHNSTYFVLLITTQVLVRYKVSVREYPLVIDMDTQILETFSKDWEELNALLKVLDPVYFAPLATIVVKPRLPVPPDLKTSDSSEHMSATKSRSVIIVFVIVAVGVCVSLMTLVPVLCAKRNSTLHPAFRVQTASTDNSEAGNAPCSSGNFRTCDYQSSEGGGGYVDQGIVVRLYSADKLNKSLHEIRVQKYQAEKRLKQSLEGIQNSLKTIDRKEAQTIDIPKLPTSSTENASDLESPGLYGSSRQSFVLLEAGIREEYQKLSHCRNSTRSLLQPVPVVSTQPNMSRSASCSTITAEGSSSSEDREFDVVSCFRQPDYSQFSEVSDDDDFGSIAESLPPTYDRGK